MAGLGIGTVPSRATRAMVFKSNVLVVANRTALSIGLEAVLRARVESGPASFTLLVPLGRTRDSEQTARNMAARLCEAGFEVQGRAGDTDPLLAVLEVWSPAEFDEIIVSTLPASTSRWMRVDLMRRIERQTGALVRHVEAREQLTPAVDRRLAGSRL
jgi:hypothetical protein